MKILVLLIIVMMTMMMMMADAMVRMMYACTHVCMHVPVCHASSAAAQAWRRRLHDWDEQVPTAAVTATEEEQKEAPSGPVGAENSSSCPVYVSVSSCSSLSPAPSHVPVVGDGAVGSSCGSGSRSRRSILDDIYSSGNHNEKGATGDIGVDINSKEGYGSSTRNSAGTGEVDEDFLLLRDDSGSEEEEEEEDVL